MPASKKTLLHLYLMCIYTTTLWQRQFTMQYTSWALKQNFLPSDAVLTKYAAKRTYPKLSSLLIPFTPQIKSLIVNPIHINSTQQPSSKNCVGSLLKTKTTPLNSESVPVISNRDFIKRLIKIQNYSIHNSYFRVKHLGIIAKSLIATTSSVNGRWLFKRQTEKGGTFLI